MKFEILLFAGTFLMTVLCTPLALAVGKRIGAIDKPNERKIHKQETVRLGGLAIFIAVNLGVVVLMAIMQETFSHYACNLSGILGTGTMLFIVCVIDDCRNISASVKLASQIVCACIVFFTGNQLEINNVGLSADSGTVGMVLSLIMTVCWIVLLTNAINLIDGADGLAAGVVGIGCIALAYVAGSNHYYVTSLLLVIVAGASLGILPFNFYPAKIFMGDCGSAYLGFMAAGISLLQPIKSASLITYMMVLMAFVIPVSDIFFTSLKRVIQKKPIMKADRNHLHHVLLKQGMGQRRLALYIYSIAALSGLDAIVYSKGLRVTALLLAVTLIIHCAIISLQRVEK